MEEAGGPETGFLCLMPVEIEVTCGCNTCVADTSGSRKRKRVSPFMDRICAFLGPAPDTVPVKTESAEDDPQALPASHQEAPKRDICFRRMKCLPSNLQGYIKKAFDGFIDVQLCAPSDVEYRANLCLLRACRRTGILDNDTFQVYNEFSGKKTSSLGPTMLSFYRRANVRMHMLFENVFPMQLCKSVGCMGYSLPLVGLGDTIHYTCMHCQMKRQTFASVPHPFLPEVTYMRICNNVDEAVQPSKQCGCRVRISLSQKFGNPLYICSKCKYMLPVHDAGYAPRKCIPCNTFNAARYIPPENKYVWRCSVCKRHLAAICL